MSNNYYDDDEELSRPKKKNSPIFMLSLVGLFVIALGTGAYYVFFSPDFINEPITQRPTTQTKDLSSDSSNPLQTQGVSPLNPSPQDPSGATPSLNTQNPEAQNNLLADNANVAQETQESSQNALSENQAPMQTQDNSLQTDNAEAPFPFEDYSAENSENPQDLPPSAQSNATHTNTTNTNTKSTDENSLAVHNMNNTASNTSAQSSNTKQETQQNPAQIRANTSEINANNHNFAIAPPTNNTNNFYIATEEELAQKRQAMEQSRLEQLQRAKANQVELTEEQKAQLPSSNMITLNDTSVSQLPNNDPTITQLFLHSMAQMLVNNYNTKQNNVATNSISASKLSQYFGTTLRGLTHPKGRSGIFDYAYQPQMITKIADYMTPRLLEEMNIVAKQKGLSAEEEVKMYHAYGNHVAETANILNAVTKTSNIKALINQTLAKEKLLLAKKQDFAEQQIEFENAKLERKNTEKIEQNMQKIAKEAAIFEQEYLTSKRLVVGAVFKEFPDIQKVNMSTQARQEEIYELALWAYRRNNASANNAAINALTKFATTLKSQ